MSVRQAEKKPGLMDRIKRYVKGSWSELKKVHWPNKSELVTYTSVVLVAVVIVSAMIWVVDSALSFVLELLI
ncbi:MAG: preprotein translocase subunit SecE [Peptococcales bacterium]|jgi:preprotein translocase subunit SecE